jgi:hypothetical protein
MRFRLEYDGEAYDDLDDVDSFDLPSLRRAIALLTQQPDVSTRNRRPLARPVSWCPEATWQQRVGGYRILYCFGVGVVRILRVKWKGSMTLEEVGR